MARRLILFPLFAVSGAAALVYETLWLRTLVLTFGSTVFALGTILAAFMAGLAAGSLVIGRATARHENPLRLYGLLEVGVGLSALALPALFAGARGATVALFPDWPEGNALFPIFRFAVSFAILLIPTFLMGGTLPAMTRLFVTAREDLGRTGGFLYVANTAGAVVGTLAGTFALLPALGMAATNHVAVAANLAVGAAALALSRRAALPGAAAGEAAGESPAAAAPAPPTDSLDAAPRIRPSGVYALYALGGFAALALEVVWTRALLLTLGTTVYAFSTMLATYLLGLALGGLLGARVAARSRAPERALALLYLGAGVAVLVGNRFLGTLPLRYLHLQFALGLDWNASLLVKFFLAMLVMLPPTFLLGAAFPVALRLVGRTVRESGAAVGRLYAANTTGSILGSFLGAVLFIPLFGLEKGLAAVAALFLAVSLGLLALARSRALVPAAAVAAVALVGSALFPGWDRYLMRSGVYVYASRYRQIDEFLRARRDYQILFYREGPEATVAVVDGQKYRYLQINGKTDASTGKDMITQVISGHLPLLFHANPKKALVIGLGCGVTLGAVERHPVESIRCLEIAPEVVEAAALFSDANGGALDDPRVTMTIGDGRNFLLHTRETFDVIVSEPSNPWIAGIGNLFTREFLSLARAHLAPGGVMCQWTNLYDLSESDLAIMLATYREAFPHGAIFLSHLGDLLLIGTQEPPALDFDTLLGRLSEERIQDDLRRVGISTLYDLFGTFVTDFDGLGPLVPAGTAIHTDDRAQLEFSAPKNLNGDFTRTHLARIVPLQQPILPLVAGIPEDTLGVEIRQAFTASAAARNFFLQGTLQAGSGDIVSAVRSLREANRLAPDEKNIAETFAEYLALEGTSLSAAGDLDGAVARFREAAAAAPGDARYPLYLGRALVPKDPSQAIDVLGEAVRLDPKLPEARRALAQALSVAGREREARHQLGILIEARPDDATLLLERGNIAAREGDFAAAMQDYLRALAVDARLREARVNLAFAYAQTGNVEKAISEYRVLFREKPDDVPVLFNLATLTTRAGERKEATRLWEELVRLQPNNEEFRRNLAMVKEGS
jgi:spermidine synthase